jgi:hypothetical protein
MAREISVFGGFLNIRVHPHSEEIYRELLQDMHRLKRTVRLRGDRWGIIRSLSNSLNEDGFIIGVLTIFTHIDKDAPWFDTEKMDMLTDEEKSEIQIPDNTFPNAKSFYFLFDPQRHRLVGQTYSRGDTLAISSWEKLFTVLSEDSKIFAKFGDIKITTEQDQGALEYVFDFKRLKTVTVSIKKPNADILNDNFEDEIEEYLEEMNSREMKFVLEAEKGESIRVDDRLMKIARPALDLGSVNTKGDNGQGIVPRSTDEIPRIDTTTYNPEEVSESTAVSRLLRDR